jgi:hypothetical protein
MRCSLAQQIGNLKVLSVLAVGLALTVPTRPAAAQSCSQLSQYATYYQQQIQQLTQWYNQNCGSSPYCSSVSQAIQHDKSMIQYISNLENSSGCNSTGGGTGDDPCTITRNYISQHARASYNRIYPWVYSILSQYYSYFTSGRFHGFYFVYDTPPIYCMDNPASGYQRAPRAYYATWDQALRVVSQFTNNGYYIEGAGVW